jgi:predicted RNA binding protein YcfA (HicA-like mRNA interferase family)
VGKLRRRPLPFGSLVAMCWAMRPHDRRDVVRLLLFLGFSSTGNHGPHEKFIHDDGRRTVVPRHSPVKPGVCRAIANDIGILPQRFDRMVRR